MITIPMLGYNILKFFLQCPFCTLSRMNRTFLYQWMGTGVWILVCLTSWVILKTSGNFQSWNLWWSRWRHQMETCSASLTLCKGNSPVTDEFPSQRPVTWSFGILFDLHQDKRLGKPSRRRWFETRLRSLWCHCNADIIWNINSLRPSDA